MENELSPEELAQQLRKPTGETGLQVAKMMNESNRFICLKAYELLPVKTGDAVLEVGFGNGLLVDHLLNRTSLTYTGVDFSPYMVEAANLAHRARVKAGALTFLESSISSLPFSEASFHGIVTTNTLYFWPNVTADLLELKRVLKPGGSLVIAIRPKATVENLPIAKHGFQLYEIEEITRLLAEAGFTAVEHEQVQEPDLAWQGQQLKMESLYISATKPY